MVIAPGSQGTAIYCVIAGVVNFSLDGGATWTPTGSGGGGTIHTSAPLSGDGSVGTPATIAAGAVPLTALAVEAANTIVGNGTGGSASPTALSKSAALSLLGIMPGTWKDQMFAFSKSLYPTIATDFLLDFVKGGVGAPTGNLSDYVAVAIAASGAATISGAQNGGAVLLSSAGNSGGQVGVVGAGQPVINANSKTGAPWFYAARVALGSDCVITATSLIEWGPTPAPSAYSQTQPFIGIAGATSTTKLVISSGAAAGVVTTVNIPTLATPFDVGVGFDGTTLTFFQGDINLGTFVSIGTSTLLSGFVNSPIGPGTIVQAGATTSVLDQVVDKLYMSSAPF